MGEKRKLAFVHLPPKQLGDSTVCIWQQFVAAPLLFKLALRRNLAYEISSLPYSRVLDYSTFEFTTLPYPTRSWKTTTRWGLITTRNYQYSEISGCQNIILYCQKNGIFQPLSQKIDFHLFVGPTGHIPSKKLFFRSLPKTQLQFGQVGRFDTVPSKVITYHQKWYFPPKSEPLSPRIYNSITFNR